MILFKQSIFKNFKQNIFAWLIKHPLYLTANHTQTSIVLYTWWVTLQHPHVCREPCWLVCIDRCSVILCTLVVRVTLCSCAYTLDFQPIQSDKAWKQTSIITKSPVAQLPALCAQCHSHAFLSAFIKNWRKLSRVSNPHAICILTNNCGFYTF